MIRLRRVLVDLTPLLPGGANGGAKQIALALLPQLAAAAPQFEFVLLTREETDSELARLDGPNLSRMCVLRQSTPQARPHTSWRGSLRAGVRHGLGQVLPPRALRLARRAYQAATTQIPTSRLARQLSADLLFCPFTAPLYFHPAVPLVSIVHDLQYADYPQFFTAEERFYRARDFARACVTARRLVCMSDAVRDRVLQTGRARPEQVVTIRPGLLRHLEAPDRATAEAALNRFAVHHGRYLLYPANFWPNKNHEMLLTAFGIFRARNPGSDLMLVCTGHTDERALHVRNAARRMGLLPCVRLPGFVSDVELGALFASCRALIFPSLYEGFGLPLLEAMALGRAILCSDLPSLREVAGDAALYFDPHNIEAMVQAINTADSEPSRLDQLADQGRKRLSHQADDAAIAISTYLAVFNQVTNQSTGVGV